MSGVLSREAGEDVGVYAIRQGTLFISNNYRISFVGASLTIKALFNNCCRFSVKIIRRS
ncbi:MAG: hypothetical protein IPN67_20900 [Bacteroidales bacterium]|nr:hypothetical protein [Bacteroidales bacterium]